MAGWPAGTHFPARFGARIRQVTCRIMQERTSTGASTLMSNNGQTATKPKVLVVDDERVIADTLAIILNQNGFDASAVYTSSAAGNWTGTLNPDSSMARLVTCTCSPLDIIWTAVPAPALTPAPLAAYFPPPEIAPITAPTAAPPPASLAVFVPGDFPAIS